MSRTFDPKCYDLAEHFLSDMSDMPEEWRKAQAPKLAYEIQQSIEDWMSSNDSDRQDFILKLAEIL